MLSPRVVRPQPHHGTASAASSSSSRRHMVDADAPNSCGGVPEWEVGLPSAAELTPVSQPLIPPALAAAFGIGPADAGVLPSSVDARFLHDSPTSHLSSRFDDYDEEEGEGETEDAATGGDGGRGEKKARMVWTPSLHHRFVEAVEHLGEKGAVPKAIVRLMNVDGLTRENVASHLQKYRLYLKRSRTGGVTATQPPQSLPPPYFPRFGAQAPRDTANLNSCWKKMQNSKLRHKAKEEDASSVMKMNPLFFKLSLGSLDELSMDGVSCKRLSSLWRCEHNKYGNSS